MADANPNRDEHRNYRSSAHLAAYIVWTLIFTGLTLWVFTARPIGGWSFVAGPILMLFATMTGIAAGDEYDKPRDA